MDSSLLVFVFMDTTVDSIFLVVMHFKLLYYMDDANENQKDDVMCTAPHAVVNLFEL